MTIFGELYASGNDIDSSGQGCVDIQDPKGQNKCDGDFSLLGHCYRPDHRYGYQCIKPVG